MTTTNETISKIFRDAFQAHPARQSDPALALESAREAASAAVPGGATGRFDDERLTFTADITECGALSEGRICRMEPGHNGNHRYSATEESERDRQVWLDVLASEGK